MLLLPKELESASKMQIPEEDIHQVLELSDGSIVVASDKKLYLFSIKKDNTLILNCSMKMLGRPRSFGLNELPNDIIIDYRENHLISYNKNNLEIQKSIEVLITSSLFISSLNYGMVTNRNKTSFYDLPELNFLFKIKGNDQQGDLWGLCLDEEGKKILLYSDNSFSVYHIDIQTLDKTVIRTNKILFMQKLK